MDLVRVPCLIVDERTRIHREGRFLEVCVGERDQETVRTVEKR